MPAAARVGDSTSHIHTSVLPGPPMGTVGPPGGRATAGTPVVPLGGEVLIGGFPATCEGDELVCETFIGAGDATVLIGGA
ncbi:PAAR domain-containing protein [Kitasatospora sp. NPDC052896]|uniref:PAAR domain-containing protein n=1 Tax=Kitasatospora sp. NPDC052896 TaxID=3364061 RepID=UPI0037CA52BC